MTAITSFPANSRRAPRHVRRAALPLALAAALTVGSAPVALAQVASTQLPTGGSIVGGTGTINAANGASRVVDQTSSRMALTWSAFDIGSAATMTFNQPSSNAVVLNLVQGGNPTQIYGNLNANGQVFLLNSNGMLIGSEAGINVGGLVLSTLGTNVSSFMSGNYAFDAGGNTVALISNSGTINAAAGGVALIGGRVANSGTITAQGGNITLTGADAATLTFESGGFGVLIDKPLQLSLGPEAITNSGILSSPGGAIKLEARAAAGLFDRLINNSGTIRAASLTGGPDGSVSLVASGGSSFDIVGGGSIDAGTGGITISARRSVQQTGVLTGGSLDGSIGGNATLTGANQISSIGGDVGGNLELRNGRDLGQRHGLWVTGASTFTMPGNTLVLDSAANSFVGQVNISAGAATIFSSSALAFGSVSVDSLKALSNGALNLGSGTIRGALNAASNGGRISTNAGNSLSVGGTADINAGTGDIALGNSRNTFLGTVNLAGANTDIASGGALRLGTLSTGNLTAGSTGTLELGNGLISGTLFASTNHQAITQAAGAGLTVTGFANVLTGSGDITLANVGNDFQSDLWLRGGAVRVADRNALSLWRFEASSLDATSFGRLEFAGGTSTGALKATSHGGEIIQTEALTIGGNAAFDAGAGEIALGRSANDFAGALDLRGGSITVHDRNDLTVSALASGANAPVDLFSHGTLTLGNFSIDTGSGALRLASGGGALRTTGAIRAGAVVLHGRDGLQLGHDVASGSVMTLSSGNSAISQIAGAIDVSGVATIDAGTGAVALEQAANNFRGEVAIKAGSARIVDQDALALRATEVAGALRTVSGGDLRLAGQVSASDIDMSVGGLFRNNVGPNALSASGLWRVFLASPLDGHVYNGLDSGGTAVWNTPAFGAVSASGNRYVFAYQPTLRWTSVNRSKTYGDSASLSDAFTVSGLMPGAPGAYRADTLGAIATGAPSLDSLGRAPTATVVGGPYAIEIGRGTLDATASGYALAFDSAGLLTVDRAGLTVQASDASKTYGQTATLREYSVSGLRNSDAVSSVELVSGGAVRTASVGDYVITAGDAEGTGLSNYDITYADGVLRVGRAGLTIRASDASKTYGDQATLSRFTVEGLLNGDRVESVDLVSAGSAATARVGGYVIEAENADGLGLSNYDISYANGLLTVSKAGLVITAGNASKTYGQTAVLSAFAASGLRNQDSVSSVALSSDGAAAGANAGDYRISAENAEGVGLDNYDVSYVDGTLSVGKAGLRVRANDASKTYGDTTVLSGFTAEGLVNGDSVSSAALSSDGAATTAVVGDYRIVASGASGQGLFNYDITYADSTLSVGKAGLTITAANAGKVYGETADLTGYAVSGLRNADAVSTVALESDGSASTVNVGGYLIRAGGAEGSGLSNYDITYVDGLLSVSKAGLTITALGASKTYGQALAPTMFQAEGLRNADAVASVALSSAGSAETAVVGDYLIRASGAGGAGLSNYDITYIDGVLSVGKAALTITALGARKTYGDAAQLSAYRAEGLVNADRVSTVALSSEGSAETATVGNYVIRASGAEGAGLSNYSITYIDGVLTVGKAGLTITASDETKRYGTAARLDSYAVSGLKNGDQVSSVSLSSAGAPANALRGRYRIEAGAANGSGLSNYDVRYVDGTLSVIDATSQPDASAIASATRAAHTPLARSMHADDATAQDISVQDGGVALPVECDALDPTTGSCRQAPQQR